MGAKVSPIQAEQVGDAEDRIRCIPHPTILRVDVLRSRVRLFLYFFSLALCACADCANSGGERVFISSLALHVWSVRRFSLQRVGTDVRLHLPDAAVGGKQTQSSSAIDPGA